MQDLALKFQQITHLVYPNATLVRSWQLGGGVSAQVTGLEITLPDGDTQKLIVRQHGEIDRASNPHIAGDEFKLLRKLKSAGLPVPAPIFVDETSTIFDAPFIVIEYIGGKTEFNPVDLADFLQQFSTTLANIHHFETPSKTLSFLPQQHGVSTNQFRHLISDLDSSWDEARIRDILAAAGPLSRHNPSVLLHGDYWPGNVLWKNDQLVAVIDWEDAGIGDPLSDVANSRLEILWAFGVEAMHRFTTIYRSLTNLDLSNLPFWDLRIAIQTPTGQFAEWAAGWPELGRPDVTAQTLHDGHRWFIQNALNRVSD